MTAVDGGGRSLTVIELAGPITSRTGRILALLGHRVIRVGEPVVGGPWDDGKTEVAPADVAVLADGADVVLVGADDEHTTATLAAPGAHVVILTPWGRGRRAAWPASDHVVAAAGGWSGQIGHPDGAPITPPDEQAWTLTAVVGAIAALLGSANAGRLSGGVSEVAAVDVVSATLEVGALAWIHDRRTVPRPGRDHPLVPHQLLRAADGWVATGLGGNDSMWARLRDWLAAEGDSSLSDAAYASGADRVAHRDAIAAVLQRFCGTRTRADLMTAAQSRRVPWAAVLTPSEVALSAQMAARRFVGRNAAGVAPRMPWLTTASPNGAASAAAGDAGRGVLEGVTVLDLTWVLAGPFATRILADHGADVIKVESLARPDPTRFSPAMHLGADRSPGAGETSGYFANHNRNKRSLALNLRHADALAVLRRLIRASDVVVDNFSAGTLGAWGLGPDELWALRPDLVVAELSGVGQTGPWRDYVSYADAVSALSGLTALTRDDDGEPIGVVFGLADLVAGYHGALAVVSALWQRSRTGRGAYVDIAQLEAMAFNLSSSLATAATGSTADTTCPGDVAIRCADGEWCAASLGRDGHGAVRRRAAEVAAEDLAAELRGKGFPAARVADGRYLVETDRNGRAVPFYGAVDHPVIGEHLVELDPIVVDGARPPIRRGAPLLGQHTREVLTALGGFADTEVDDLVARGVLR
ncbi:MAG: CoA transferase [Acidimicrobiales bacterium]